MAGSAPRHASAPRAAFGAKGGFWLNAGTEGVSRAGAVGTVLNEYFNRVLGDHEDDYRSFFLQNRRISPNPYVLRVMKETLGL